MHVSDLFFGILGGLGLFLFGMSLMSDGIKAVAGSRLKVLLAALRSSRMAKGAAMGHTIFNVIGVIYILPIVWVGSFGALISWITPWELTQYTIMADMAAANTLIKVVNTALFIPLIGVLEAIVQR